MILACVSLVVTTGLREYRDPLMQNTVFFPTFWVWHRVDEAGVYFQRRSPGAVTQIMRDSHADALHLLLLLVRIVTLNGNRV